MSDWEDFCESKGWNAGSSEDYDRFLGSMDDKPLRKNRLAFLQFATFEEAKVWAMGNVGKSFTRNPNGPGFVPVQRKDSLK